MKDCCNRRLAGADECCGFSGCVIEGRPDDAFGTTSIIVTYDVSESLKVVDYLYVIADGVVAGGGTPEEMLASTDPVVHQFLHAEPEGPIAFHYPAQPMREQLGPKRA